MDSMHQENEQTNSIEIRSADDVWSAMYEYGIKNSLGGILEYFMMNRESDDFEGFCHSLDEEHLKEALDYFLQNFNKDKFILFLNALNVNQQTTVLSFLLIEACESKKMGQKTEVIHFRQNLCFIGNSNKKYKLPQSVQGALQSAQDNSFDEVIYFLQRNPLEIRKFVSQLNGLKNDILNDLTLQLMNCLKHESKMSPEEKHLPFAA